MKFNVVTHPVHCVWRQSTNMRLRCRRELHKCANGVQTWTRVDIHVRSIARDTCRRVRWRNKCRTAVAAGGNQERRAEIHSVLAPEDVWISLEEFPYGYAGLQSAIIQQESPARGTVCADDALVTINGQQHTCGRPVRRHYRDDPLSMELLSKKSLFYGACRLCHQSARQRMCSFGKFRIDGRYVQNRE